VSDADQEAVAAALIEQARPYFANSPSRMTAVEERVREFVHNGGSLGVRFAASYVRWAIAQPGNVGKRAPFRVCLCDNGFFWSSTEGQGTVRLCYRCLGVEEPREEEPPPPDEPPPGVDTTTGEMAF
jgi:hypothetical protein